MSNYAPESDLKSPTGTNISKFAKKADLVSLKSDVDELDTDKLKTVPLHLSKLSNVVENDVVGKTVYDKLVSKVMHLILKDLFWKLDITLVYNQV